MADDQARLGAAGRIADGEMVDWASITATLRSDDDRALAEELEIVQQIAAGHRELHHLLPAASDTPPHLVPDRARWGHLDLLNIVGRGSFGIVYRAWDTRLERLVALKLFHGASNPDAVMQEGRMLARVRHENVVTVYGADMLDGVAGIWMELVHGQTLDFIVRKSGPLPPKEAAAVGADVSRALAAVHAAGLLHCDVKAQNVVREQSGRVVLMDLGAGRLVPEMRDDGDQLTDVAGTPRYMAPELFVSMVNATKASDIYSLGVMIFFLASGEFPVEGKTLGDLRRAHEKGRVRSLAAVSPSLPKPIIDIVTRSIDANPALRPAAVTEIQDALASAATAVEPVPAPRLNVRWWLLAAAVAIGAIALLAVRPFLNTSSPPLPPEHSIAVMPIKNLTGDPAMQYLADGLTEVLMAHLARVPGLQVSSAATMLSVRGSSGDDRALAQKLGVRLLLAGSVLQADNRIALSVNLTDPHQGRAIWGTEIERQPATILSARSEIASLVAARLSLRGTVPAEKEQKLKPEAQDAFLRALVALAPDTSAGIASAIELLGRAVAAEPTWADPLAYLAFAQQRALEGGNPVERRARAEVVRTNALRAIQLDPSLPMSYTALAAVQAYNDWDLTAAEETLRQGIAAYPRNATARQRLALVLAATGRLQEAVAEAERARDEEPLVAERHAYLGVVRYYARDFEGALTEADRAVAMAPGYPVGYLGRARILSAMGRHDDAIASCRQAIAISETPGFIALLGGLYATAGHDSNVADVLKRLRALEAKGVFVSVDNYAYIAGSQGKLDEAFRLVDEAVDRRMTNVLWLAVNPRADSLRGDPRFERLVAKMGLISR